MASLFLYFPMATYLLCITGIDDTGYREIYKTYMNFGRIADYGQSYHKKRNSTLFPNYKLIINLPLDCNFL